MLWKIGTLWRHAQGLPDVSLVDLVQVDGGQLDPRLAQLLVRGEALHELREDHVRVRGTGSRW